MNFKAEIDSSNHAYAIYKIKRLAKILAVCAGIIVVSVSLGMISALEWAQRPRRRRNVLFRADHYFIDRRHRRILDRCVES
jgi:hypothetical protein